MTPLYILWILKITQSFDFFPVVPHYFTPVPSPPARAAMARTKLTARSKPLNAKRSISGKRIAGKLVEINRAPAKPPNNHIAGLGRLENAVQNVVDEFGLSV